MWRFFPQVSDPGAGKSKKRDRADRDKDYDQNKRQRCYRKEWESEFKWLAYDDKVGLMYCKVCRAGNVAGDRSKKLNVFYKGSDNFKTD